MRIGKYDIKIEQKSLLRTIGLYSFYVTWTIIFIDRDPKLICRDAALISGLPFLWDTFWFNYYEYKNQKKLLNKEQSVEECDAT
jgi:hypothetical protein